MYMPNVAMTQNTAGLKKWAKDRRIVEKKGASWSMRLHGLRVETYGWRDGEVLEDPVSISTSSWTKPPLLVADAGPETSEGGYGEGEDRRSAAGRSYIVSSTKKKAKISRRAADALRT